MGFINTLYPSKLEEDSISQEVRAGRVPRHTRKNPALLLSRFFGIGMSPLISSNHFFLCGNRDAFPRDVYLVYLLKWCMTRGGTCPLNLPRTGHRCSSVPFHGLPMNFMGSLMKSFQNSPPRNAAILSWLNWTNRISSEPNLRPGSPFHLSLVSSERPLLILPRSPLNTLIY